MVIIFPFIACGGELTGEGVIRSPFHPNAYPGQRTCRWTISQPPKQIVLLNFTDFQIGNSPCDTDYIEVRVKYHWILLKALYAVYMKRSIAYTDQYLINIDMKFPSRMLLNRIQYVHDYIPWWRGFFLACVEFIIMS